MSSVGFSSQSKDYELERLRQVFQSLNDCLRGIINAESCIDRLNFGLAKDQLNAVRWHVGEAQKVLKTIGQAKNQKASVLTLASQGLGGSIQPPIAHCPHPSKRYPIAVHFTKLTEFVNARPGSLQSS